MNSVKTTLPFQAAAAATTWLLANAVLAAPPQTQPAWTWQPSAGIEWVEPVGDPGSRLVLAATGDARLLVIDADAPSPPPNAPIEAHPGVTLAGHVPCAPAPATAEAPCSESPRLPPVKPPDQTVYCYDRFSIYALTLGPPAALRWQVGAWRAGVAERPGAADDAQTFQGDPEELRRIVAAQAMATGVLVVRDDGRVGLFDRADGHIRLEWRLPRCPSARLHVCGDQVALLSVQAGRPAAVSLDLAAGTRRDIALPPDATWPIWSTLAQRGLLLVQPDRVTLCEPGGTDTMLYSDPTAAILGPTITLCTAPASESASQAAPALLFGSTDGRLRMLDLAAGQLRWTADDQVGPPGHLVSTRICGERVLTASDRELRVYALTTGVRRAQLPIPFRDQLIDCDARGDTLRVLWSVASGTERYLRLDEFDLSPESRLEWQPEPAPALVAHAQLNLGPAAGFLQAVWNSDRVLVATRAELRAYVPP